MFSQTIALFRYLLSGLINTRLLILLLGITLTGILSGQYISELAIINSKLIGLAFTAELLRYCLLFFMVVSIAYRISQDYELGQFDRLLSMPITRAQYVFSQLLVILTAGFIFSIPVIVSMPFFASFPLAVYWFLSVYLELILIGLFTMLAILSLEKLPVAIIFSVAAYLLSRLIPQINSALEQSVDYYSDEVTFRFSEYLFKLLQYVLPTSSSFAQNNILFELVVNWENLIEQSLSVFIYGGFLLFISLIDFYRKEFNH